MSLRRTITNGLVLFALLGTACAGVGAGHDANTRAQLPARTPRLVQPGNAIFGAIQEVVENLAADPNTDWSKIDIEALRQHLLDMQAFTDDVRVVSKQDVPNGVELTVRPTTPRAVTALEHVLSMHPMMLEKEAGWTTRVDHEGKNTILTVTTHNPHEVAEIRGLGYIGLMAYGSHHRLHHWMIATGQMAWPPSQKHRSTR